MKGLHQEKSLENLKQRFGKNAASKPQVCFWFGEFRRGRRSFDDEHQCDTSANAVTVTNIEVAATRRQTNNDGLGMNGVSSCCESSRRPVQK